MIHSAFKIFNIVREKVEGVNGVIQFRFISIAIEEDASATIDEVTSDEQYQAVMKLKDQGVKIRVAPETIIFLSLDELDQTDPGFHGPAIRLIPIFAKLPEAGDLNGNFEATAPTTTMFESRKPAEI